VSRVRMVVVVVVPAEVRLLLQPISLLEECYRFICLGWYRR